MKFAIFGHPILSDAQVLCVVDPTTGKPTHSVALIEVDADTNLVHLSDFNVDGEVIGLDTLIVKPYELALTQ